MKRKHVLALIIIGVLIIDQWSKVWIKTNMFLGEEFLILGLDWARIHFVENPGMAFGLTFGGDYGKLFLSLFRLVAVGFLFYYLKQLNQSGAKLGLLVGFALILSGALGNIIDSVFYGQIFSASGYHNGAVAALFPEGGGYAGWLHGRVVDMFYFPMLDTVLPDWLPFWGGERFQFFRPVFNVADSAITGGVLYILIFQRSFFQSKDTKDEQKPETEIKETNPPA